MEKLKPKTIKCIAGSGKLLLYSVIIMELVLGACAVAIGIISHNGWMLAVGLAVAAFGLFSAAGTRLAPLGHKLVLVSEGCFYLSGYLGTEIDRDNYGWIEKTELTERAGKKTLYIYTNDRSIFKKSGYMKKYTQEKDIRTFGTPVAIRETDIERLGVNRFDLEELSQAININRLLEKINSLDDENRLSSRLSINDKALLFMAGEELQLCHNGILLKPIGDEEITLFSDDSLKMVSIMVAKEKNKCESALILLYEPMNFLLISNDDPIFQSLLDGLLHMKGFDVDAYNDAYEKADNTLHTCYNSEK